jgi:hypothetical protein
MKSLGGNLFFFGVGAIVLYFLQMEFIVLAWIDMWGPTVGWSIRIGLVVVGGALWLMGNKKESVS